MKANHEALRQELKDHINEKALKLYGVANECDIPSYAIYHFNAGIREMTDEQTEKLIEYLNSDIKLEDS